MRTLGSLSKLRVSQLLINHERHCSVQRNNFTSGTVLRATQPKFLEYKTDYICGHCKITITVEGEYAKNYAAVPPGSCPNGCKGMPYSDETNVVNENFITYQEIKIMVRRVLLIYSNFTFCY